jgi:hypothetical protein
MFDVCLLWVQPNAKVSGVGGGVGGRDLLMPPMGHHPEYHGFLLATSIVDHRCCFPHPQLCIRLGGSIGLERSSACASFPSEHGDAEDDSTRTWTVLHFCIPVTLVPSSGWLFVPSHESPAGACIVPASTCLELFACLNIPYVAQKIPFHSWVCGLLPSISIPTTTTTTTCLQCLYPLHPSGPSSFSVHCGCWVVTVACYSYMGYLPPCGQHG